MSPVLMPNNARKMLKVCGMRDAKNLAAVAGLRPDWVGFIFHPASARYVGEAVPTVPLPPETRRVGVFVNEPLAEMQQAVARFGLAAVQLHGQETPATAAALQADDVLVIKAFAIGSVLDENAMRSYLPYCDLFLFDTQGPKMGGNGAVFNWNLLREYSLNKPYLLAGGLGPEHADRLAELSLPGLVGFDLNSRFETEPGIKNVMALEEFFAKIRQ